MRGVLTYRVDSPDMRLTAPANTVEIEDNSGRRRSVSENFAMDNRGEFASNRWRVVRASQRQLEALGLAHRPPEATPSDSPPLRPVILHIIPWDLHVGGAQRFVADLATWQREIADVWIYAPGNSDHWRDQFAGVNVRGWDADAPADRVTFIRRLNPTIIHHHHPSGGVLMDVAKLYPLIQTQHGYMQNENPGPGVTPIAGPLAEDRYRLGVDLGRFHPKGRKSDFIVGISCRWADIKIPTSFLEAVAAREIPGVTWRLIGRGSENRHHAAVQEIVDSCPWIEAIGDVPPEQMPDAYRELSVLCVPSLLDSTSYAALEGMATGLPIVAREIQGLPFTVGDGGLLANSDAGLIAAVEQLKDNHRMRRTLGKRARARAESVYDLRRMSDAYADLYEERTGGLVRRCEPGLEASVVMPVYNMKADWLREAIESVLSQEDAAFELVIVDDGSTAIDTTAVLIDYAWRYADSKLFRLITLDENTGCARALNVGVRAARSDLIIRMDSDDWMAPWRIARQVALMAENPELALISGQMKYMGPDGELTGRETSLSFDEGRSPAIQPWAIAHPTVAVRRHAVLSLGGYEAGHDPAQDFDLWCRMFAAGYRMRTFDEAWLHQRRHPGQSVTNPDLPKIDAAIRAKYAPQGAA